MRVHQITAVGKSPRSVKVPPVCSKKEKVSGFQGVLELQLSVSRRKLDCVCKREKEKKGRRAEMISKQQQQQYKAPV